MDKIFIHNLTVSGIIGVYDWERESPPEIRISITLFADLRKAGRTDNIQDCVDYSETAATVQRHVENSARLTVEALAADIAQICLMSPEVVKVRVRVEKPAAVPAAQSVGVEIERERGDFDL